MLSERIIAIFAPYSLIENHHISEVRLARLLSKEGAKVHFITCNSGLPGLCTVMESYKLDLAASQVRRREICDACISASKNPRLSSDQLSLKMSAREEAKFREYVDVFNTKHFSLAHRKVPVGQIALYETLIKYKKTSTELNELEQKYYLETLANTIATTDRAFDFFHGKKIDTLLCYSPQYAVPGAFCAVASLYGANVYFIEGSSNFEERYSHLRIWNWDKYGLNQPAMDNLEKYSSYKLSPKILKRVNRQIQTLEKAGSFSVYSSKPKNLSTKATFGLNSYSKVVLLCMSSYDEVFSAVETGRFPKEKLQSTVFADQYEWLQEVIEWVSEKREVCLIIRPHPRDFPNKREKVLAEQVSKWVKILRNLPDNVRVDEPINQYSLYDHFKEVDVVLTGWSFSGLEALARGIPVVTYDSKLPSYPPSIHFSGLSKDVFFENIEKALLFKNSRLLIDESKRWLGFLMDLGTVKIGGPVEYGVGRNHRNIWRRVFFRTRLFTIYRLIYKIWYFRTVPTRKSRSKVSNLIRYQKNSLYECGH